MNAIEPFTPTPTQDQVWAAIEQADPGSTTIIGFGGAVGGGKTRALAELAIDLALDHPGNRILVGRKDLVDLRTTTLEEFDACCPKALIVRRAESPIIVREIRDPKWPSGVVSRIFFRELKDWIGLGSEQYGAVLLEEAGEIAEGAAKMLVTRLRHPAASKYVLVAASNPWPGWFERWFIDRKLPEDLLNAVNATVHFIPSKIEDNPHLPPNYGTMLRAFFAGDDDWLARMVEGRFDSFEGQVYRELGPHLLWEGPLPPFQRLVGGLDFGGANERAHKTAGVVAGLDYDGNLIRFAHFEHSGPDVYDLLTQWMTDVQWLMGEDERRRGITWRADKTQTWGIEQAGAKFHVVPSHGGADSVWLGIVQERKRMKAHTSYFTHDLQQPPHIGGTRLNGESWYERMRRYRWQDQPDENRAVPGVPIKRDDDTCIAGAVPILMADGSEKRMDAIVVGDRVMTLDGEGVVTAHWANGVRGTVSIGALRCTPDHPLLYADAYGYNNVEWSDLQTLSRLGAPQSPRLLAATYTGRDSLSPSRHLGMGAWADPGRLVDPSQGREPAEQRSREPGGVAVASRAHAAAFVQASGLRSQRASGSGAVAWLGRGAGVAFGARTTDVGGTRVRAHDVRPVRAALRNQARFGTALEVVLRPLQAARVVRPTTVYDLTVDVPSHTFIAGGFVVGNCDADRYMVEEADGFPDYGVMLPKTTLGGRPIARSAA